jgi:hypothetical protein
MDAGTIAAGKLAPVAPASEIELHKLLRPRATNFQPVPSSARRFGSPPMWTLAFGHHEDRMPTHGYAETREAAMAAFAKSSVVPQFEFHCHSRIDHNLTTKPEESPEGTMLHHDLRFRRSKVPQRPNRDKSAPPT